MKFFHALLLVLSIHHQTNYIGAVCGAIPQVRSNGDLVMQGGPVNGYYIDFVCKP